MPLILIPQIMLAGLIAKVSSEFVEVLSYFTLSRWGVEGFNNIQKTIIESKPTLLPNGELGWELAELNAIEELMKRFHESYSQTFSLAGKIELDTYAILVMMTIMIIAIYKVLKNKDSVSL